MPENQRSPAADRLIRPLLAGGEVELVGRIQWSSNATFLVSCSLGDDRCQAVYKPIRGERPLADFPVGLGRREVAAFELSEALGWGLVPETVLREDAPFGPGSLQYFVDADFSQHYFTMCSDPRNRAALQAVAAFDIVANNADRKSGHCLAGPDGRIWAIDNGLCFHAEPKLRTVIWDFAEEPIPPVLTEALADVVSHLPDTVVQLLEPPEIEAVVQRGRRLLADGRFPLPSEDHPYYPWPLV